MTQVFGLVDAPDVVGQGGSLGLELVDTVLHHVAEAHDPLQAAVRRDRRVPYPVLGHHADDLLDRGLRRDRAHLGGADGHDRLRHHRGAALGQRPDDIPLTGDPVDRGAVVRDDDGTDPVFHRGETPWELYIQPRSDLGGLNLSTVPKVFIECANMRNAQDAVKVTSPAWRQLAARGIAESISAFLTAA